MTTKWTEWSLQRLFKSMLATFIGRGRLSRSTSSDTDAPVDTVDLSGEPGNPAPSPLTRVETYGEITVPPNDSECVYLTLNDQGLVWSINTQRPAGVSARGNKGMFTDAENRIILRGKGDSNAGQVEIKTKAGTDVVIDKQGQVEIKTKAGASAVIDKNGKVTIDSAPGQDVSVNGGTAEVARKGDACRIDKPLALWMSQVEVALNILAPAAVTPLSGTFIAAPGIVINAGALRFKG